MGRGRTPKTEAGGRKELKYKNKLETYRFRLAVVKSFESVGISSTLSAFYPGLTGKTLETKRKNVYHWLKIKENIVAQCSTDRGASQTTFRALGLATSLPRDVEIDLVRWINDYRIEGAPVSSMMLQIRALRVAEEIDIPRGFFEASREWQYGFLKRHALSFRAKTRQGQISPIDADAEAARFAKEVRCHMDSLKIDVAFNADQTPVYFEYISKSTIEKSGAKTVWVRSSGRDKERLTCMIVGSSHGE